jgi:hypothetical protein
MQNLKKGNLCIPYQTKVLFSIAFLANEVPPPILTAGSQPKVLQEEANCTLWTGNTLFLDQICGNGLK